MVARCSGQLKGLPAKTRCAKGRSGGRIGPSSECEQILRYRSLSKSPKHPLKDLCSQPASARRRRHGSTTVRSGICEIGGSSQNCRINVCSRVRGTSTAAVISVLYSSNVVSCNRRETALRSIRSSRICSDCSLFK